MSDAVNVAILGATGYGAGELLRLFVQHPAAKVVALTSQSRVGAAVSDVHPHLRGFYDVTLADEIDYGRLLDAPKAAVFSALPHGASSKTLVEIKAEIDKRGAADRTVLIDLSGDLRLRDEALHARYYAESPSLPELRKSFVYGLPELHRAKLRGAHYVANPGCLASASILTLAPIAHMLNGLVAIDAKTGSSGAGRQLKETTHHPTRHGNFRAYKALAHQHEPEILQELGDTRGERIAASFVAQSMATARGIYVTAHCELPEALDRAALQKKYADFYADSPFVRVVSDEPELQNVVCSNFCDVSVFCRGRQVVAMAALDNLVKGMSGTAIQNLNLMCGFEETAGLWTPASRPV